VTNDARVAESRL